MKKTSTTQQIYNLIILDESGSMQGIKHQIINGFNETVQTIKSAEKKHKKQKHFVSIHCILCRHLLALKKCTQSNERHEHNFTKEWQKTMLPFVLLKLIQISLRNKDAVTKAGSWEIVGFFV